jgi:polysaccharide transporter, PST family
MIDRLKGLIRLQPMRNILALYGVRAVEQLLPLVVLPYLARTLGVEGWGLFAMAQAFAIYGIITVEFGFGYSGTRAVARARDQAGRLAELLTGICVAQLLLAAVVAIAAVLARLLVPAFHDQPLLLWAGLAFAILQGLLPLWYFTGQERIPLIAGIAVATKALATLAIFALVRDPDDGWLVLACYAGGALLATGAGYALLLREVRPGRLSLGLIGETLRLGAGMFLMRIMVLMHTAGNTFLLGLLVAPQQVAFFAAGEKLCRPIAWLLQPINTALLPRLSHLAERSPERAQQVAALTVLLQGAAGWALGAAIALLAPWLVDLLFGAEYRAAAEVLRVMAGIIPLVVINGALVSQWLIPHGLDRALNVVIVAGAVLNLILALGLAPRFGALGMAWVTVVAEACIMVGLLWALHRRGLRPLTPDLLRRGFAALPRR